MNKFRFKYSTSVWILLSIVLILSLAGLVWNVFNLLQYLWSGALKTLSYSLIILLTGALSIFVISVMAYGKYVIKDGYLYTHFGFIKNKTEINQITEITHFKKSDKLVVYFKDNQYTVIVISPDKYDQFIEQIRKVNPAVVYDARIDGEETP